MKDMDMKKSATFLLIIFVRQIKMDVGYHRRLVKLVVHRATSPIKPSCNSMYHQTMTRVRRPVSATIATSLDIGRAIVHQVHQQLVRRIDRQVRVPIVTETLLPVRPHGPK